MSVRHPRCVTDNRIDVRFELQVNVCRMVVPLLSTRTTNVELTSERRDLLKQKLFPLTRLVSGAELAHYDVSLRRNITEGQKDHYIVTARLATTSTRYTGTVAAPTYARAVILVRDMLKRQIKDAQAAQTSTVSLIQYRSPILV